MALVLPEQTGIVKEKQPPGKAMITVYPYEALGQIYNGWLNAHYHFSFAGYMNRDRMGFGPLRVLNDDIVKAGAGFDLHEHKDMEIITYVRQGAINHSDNLGNQGRTGAGDVQVMSAGSGIHHAELADKDQDTHLYQIWIRPRETGVQPRWEQKAFPKEFLTDGLNVLVSGLKQHENTGALFIHQDAAILGGHLKAGTQLEQDLPTAQAYIAVSEGSIRIGDAMLRKGDGAEVTDTAKLMLQAESDAVILVICV